MFGTGWSTEEISRDLADKMDRREGAIERKALRSKRRTTVVSPFQTRDVESFEGPELQKPRPKSEPEKEDLRSLLESVLLLAEDPKRALKVKIGDVIVYLEEPDGKIVLKATSYDQLLKTSRE